MEILKQIILDEAEKTEPESLVGTTGLLKLTDLFPVTDAGIRLSADSEFNPYPTAFPYGNGMVLHFYQQQESSTTKTVHKVINRGLKTYV